MNIPLKLVKLSKMAMTLKPKVYTDTKTLTGWSEQTINYKLLIAQARKQPITWEGCQFDY